MKWIKDNPFLIGLIAATVIGVAAVAFLLSEALGQYESNLEGYTQAVQKLHSLQALSPFPSKENLEKSRSLTSDYKTSVDNLRNRLAAMKLPVNPAITPQQFEDTLRADVNETVEKATQAGVALPKDFYLGFSPYATSLPSEQAAPFLARQLTLIKQVVQQLIDLKIQSLDDLKRTPIPQESPSTPPPAAAEHPGPGKSAAPVAADLFDRLPFDLTFTAEQSKLRVAFNSLLDRNQFLIIRSLEVQNSNSTPPPVISPLASGSSERPAPPMPQAGGFAGPPPAGAAVAVGGFAGPTPPPNLGFTASAGSAAPEKSRDLDVLFGREVVKATLRIEILNFSTPEPEKTEKK